MTRVFVAGSLHLDVILNAPRLPRLDETLMGDAVAYAFGGKGGNQALAAAQMGATVSMAGRVGSDAFGQQLRARLTESGIDHSQVLTDPGPSGMSAAIVDQNGDYGAVVVSAANRKIVAGQIAMPADTRLLVLQNEIPADVNNTLAKAAQARGIPVLWNAAPFRRNSDAIPMQFRYLILNRIEARDMSGEDDPHAAAETLHAQGYAHVIVTLGADGLLVKTGREAAKHIPAPKVQTISTHGAGDMFCGALAAQLAVGQPLEDALKFAQAAAALHVSTPVEDRAAITLAQVTRFQSR